MEKNLEGWPEIADLIKMEKADALADFHAREFAPGRLPATVFPLRLSLRPGVMAAAASLLLVAGLIFLWALRGSWRDVRPAPAASLMLSASFLYQPASGPDAGNSGNWETHSVNPYFFACARAALQRPAAAGEPVAPSAAIERGDPEEMRRALDRANREETFEQFLSQFQEYYNKEV
jgi:hypothetical protein